MQMSFHGGFFFKYTLSDLRYMDRLDKSEHIFGIYDFDFLSSILDLPLELDVLVTYFHISQFYRFGFLMLLDGFFRIFRNSLFHL